MQNRTGKIYIIIVVFFVSANVMAQDIRTDVIVNGKLSYLDTELKKEQIENLSLYDLRILRNTIFAKYHYEFTSINLQNHFFSFSWYRPKSLWPSYGNSFDVNQLTSTDWDNIALIQKVENAVTEEDGFVWRADNRGGVSITGYRRTGGAITLPNVINGMPVTSIEDNAFRNKNLSSVIIPDSVTAIGNYAFEWNNLTSVKLSNNLISIGVEAFCRNSIENITIPDSVTYIGESAFALNRLTSVTLSKSITVIRKWTFASNPLANIIIPYSVTSIELYAFSGTTLRSITIGENVKLEVVYRGSDSHREGVMGIDYGFDEAYNNAIYSPRGGRAGTYVRLHHWTRGPWARE
jgi:hypothetical protein